MSNLGRSWLGPSIKYVTLFLANFDPLPLSHFVTHPGTHPRKYVTHLGPPPPIFSRPSTKIPDKSPLYKFYLNCSRRLLSGGFCPGWFLSVSPSVTQQKVKHHFKLVTGQNGSGQNGTDKMVWTKWYTDKMVLDKMV